MSKKIKCSKIKAPVIINNLKPEKLYNIIDQQIENIIRQEKNINNKVITIEFNNILKLDFYTLLVFYTISDGDDPGPPGPPDPPPIPPISENIVRESGCYETGIIRFVHGTNTI